MSNPFVSVIIPSFNRDSQIQEAVRSVLNQSYRNFELIVVDDCSQIPVADSLVGMKDPRLSIIRHQHNAGVSVARNTGAEAAKGEYLAFLDDDDRWKVAKLGRQLDYMDQHKAECQASVTDFITSGRQSLYSRHNSRMDPAWLILTGCAMTMGSSMMVSRDVFRDVGGFDPKLRRGQDWDWLLRYHEHDYKMAIVPEALTVYRGDHRQNTRVVAESTALIEHKHSPLLSVDDRQIFEAALMWKRARNQITEKHYLQGAAELAGVAVKHPVNFTRYVKSILNEPVRRLLHASAYDSENAVQSAAGSVPSPA